MLWELARSFLGVRRRDREARWEHTRISPEENCKTHRKNADDYRIGGNSPQIRASKRGRVGKGTDLIVRGVTSDTPTPMRLLCMIPRQTSRRRSLRRASKQTQSRYIPE
ncbi:hypothetical protein BHE74_00017487 [Ensete ventricosum]|nr:hypothetical protein BHE74_00017487 [Ensete ventricosum]